MNTQRQKERMMSLKLYCIELQKLPMVYSVATDPTAAYEQVRTALEAADIGYESDRELKQITLLAEHLIYPQSVPRLFLPNYTDEPQPPPAVSPEAVQEMLEVWGKTFQSAIAAWPKYGV